MIVLIYGQPACGKTTLSKGIKNKYNIPIPIVTIDGDEWREISSNTAYDKEGRMKNLLSAFKLALNLEKQGFLPILSFVCPYEEARQFLRDKTLLVEIYLQYNEDRGRNSYAVPDFEEPKGEVLHLNTTLCQLPLCVELSLMRIYRHFEL